MVRRKKSGAQLGAENVEVLRRYLEGLKETNKPLPRRAGGLNRAEIARACGFDRQVLYQNPTAKKLLDEYEKSDRRKFLTQLESAEFEREAKSKIDKDRSALEARVLELEAENFQLRRERQQFHQIERLMLATGRLP